MPDTPPASLRLPPLKTAKALPAAVCLCVGIANGRFFHDEPVWSVAIVAATIILSLVFLRGYRLSCFIAVVAGTLLGFSTLKPEVPDEMFDRQATLTGRLIKTTSTTQTERAVVEVDKWILKEDSIERSGNFRVLCSFHSCDVPVKEGAFVTVTGKVKGIEPPNDIPYQLDFNRFLYLDGVSGYMNVYNREDYLITNHSVSRWQKFCDKLRHEWLCDITAAGFDEPTAGFMLAVIGGENELLGDDIEEQFRQSGLSHILAISGMHVGIVVLVMSFLLYPVKLLRRLRPLYFILVGLFVIVFAVAVGASPSVCRATAMCCVLMGCRIFETKPNVLQCLAVAVIVLLCFKPMWLFTPGFQFSVCAVLSIIAFMPLLDRVGVNRPVLRWLWLLLILPVVAVAGTLVPTLFYFHSFTPSFWIANIVVAIFIAPLIVLGFITTLLSMLGLFAPFAAELTNFVYSLMMKGVSLVETITPFECISFFPSGGTLAAISLTVITMAILVRHYSHLRAVGAATVITALFVFLPERTEALPTSEVYIPRHTSRTDIIVVHEGKSYLWTTADDSVSVEDAKLFVKKNYNDFFLHRKVSSEPRYIGGSIDEPDFTVANNIMRISGREIIRVDEHIPFELSEKVDYLLITERFRGYIENLTDAVKADTVLLSAATNFIRQERYSRILEEKGIPHKRLREGGFGLSFP